MESRQEQLRWINAISDTIIKLTSQHLLEKLILYPSKANKENDDTTTTKEMKNSMNVDRNKKTLSSPKEKKKEVTEDESVKFKPQDEEKEVRRSGRKIKLAGRRKKKETEVLSKEEEKLNHTVDSVKEPEEKVLLPKEEDKNFSDLKAGVVNNNNNNESNLIDKLNDDLKSNSNKTKNDCDNLETESENYNNGDVASKSFKENYETTFESTNEDNADEKSNKDNLKTNNEICNTIENTTHSDNEVHVPNNQLYEEYSVNNKDDNEEITNLSNKEKNQKQTKDIKSNDFKEFIGVKKIIKTFIDKTNIEEDDNNIDNTKEIFLNKLITEEKNNKNKRNKFYTSKTINLQNNESNKENIQQYLNSSSEIVIIEKPIQSSETESIIDLDLCNSDNDIIPSNDWNKRSLQSIIRNPSSAREDTIKQGIQKPRNNLLSSSIDTFLVLHDSDLSTVRSRRRQSEGIFNNLKHTIQNKRSNSYHSVEYHNNHINEVKNNFGKYNKLNNNIRETNNNLYHNDNQVYSDQSLSNEDSSLIVSSSTNSEECDHTQNLVSNKSRTQSRNRINLPPSPDMPRITWSVSAVRQKFEMLCTVTGGNNEHSNNKNKIVRRKSLRNSVRKKLNTDSLSRKSSIRKNNARKKDICNNENAERKTNKDSSKDISEKNSTQLKRNNSFRRKKRNSNINVSKELTNQSQNEQEIEQPTNGRRDLIPKDLLESIRSQNLKTENSEESSPEPERLTSKKINARPRRQGSFKRHRLAPASRHGSFLEERDDVVVCWRGPYKAQVCYRVRYLN